MKNRQKLIKAGKIWIVYPDGEPGSVLFEGVRTNCQRYIRANCPTAWRKGNIRLGKVIYEPETTTNATIH